MPNVKRYIGYAWAAPLTLVGIVYVTFFTMLGWYYPMGRHGDAFVWQLRHHVAPKWFEHWWMRWGGHTIGNIVVMKTDIFSPRGTITLRHEQEHVRQCMTLGIFQPILYGIASLALHFCEHAHPYYDNPFEVDARRAAGQVVDVIGALKRALEQARLRSAAKKQD
jgi:hypothetical protein